MLNEIFTKDVPLGNGYRTIGEHDSAFAFLDDVVAAMRQHNPDERPPSLTAVLRDIHVRQEMYASAQKIAALERSPVESDPQDDPLLKEPATLVGVEDYVGQVLRLKISQPVTPQGSVIQAAVPSRVDIGSEVSSERTSQFPVPG